MKHETMAGNPRYKMLLEEIHTIRMMRLKRKRAKEEGLLCSRLLTIDEDKMIALLQDQMTRDACTARTKPRRYAQQRTLQLEGLARILGRKACLYHLGCKVWAREEFYEDACQACCSIRAAVREHDAGSKGRGRKALRRACLRVLRTLPESSQQVLHDICKLSYDTILRCETARCPLPSGPSSGKRDRLEDPTGLDALAPPHTSGSQSDAHPQT